ncbi:MAG: LPS-assembly protein LptD [Alphaproteobacteria bacterium]|nr:LPS-assembly protein LptD [Alphaproteobacteria bacterium]
MALSIFNIRKNKGIRVCQTLIRTVLVSVCLAFPAFALESPSDAPVDLQADSLSHDEAAQTVTATGNVIMVQEGRTLKADRVVYDLKADTVVAVGHVEFIDLNGDRHLAEKVKFNDAMKNGFVEGLKTILADGSRFTAKKGDHEGGITTTMYDATYTPCEPCKNDPDHPPLWQIRAAEVKHDKSDKTISYKNARFEWMGVPLVYLPYFEHPDGTVKRKSGFLTPSAGYKSDLGVFVESRYYWSIAPEKDATLGVIAMARQAPVATAEWRQRWADAQLKAKGSLTYSDYVDREHDISVRQNKKWRGHIFADALWDINEKWRAGSEIKLSSDDQYLRQYDFETGNDDILENQVYFERFSGRNYAVGRLLGFQDLRVDEPAKNLDQPDVLPEIQASFLGEPGSMPLIGGRWSLEGSALGLRRESDSGQDVNRVGLGVGWQRRLVSDFGLVSVLNANARSESYFLQDRNDKSSDGTETRTFASLDAKTSYPLARSFEKFQMVVEPVASMTLAPDVNQEDIPNEDSQDVQIDASNLFESNRFPGLDQVEDQSHVTYGLRTGLYGYDGSYGDVFFGQSQRLENNDNPFVPGSGLDEKGSDFVGQISGRYKEEYSLDYRFQLANDDLAPQRHEIDASASFDSLTLSTRYLFAKSLGGTDIVETREQIENAASYYINDRWRIRGSARHDLGEDPGLREANVGLDYFGQCFSWSVTGRRNLTEDTSGDNGTEVLFRIGLKNLGEFEAAGLKLSSGHHDAADKNE